LNLLGGLDTPDAGSVVHRGQRLDFDDLGALTAWRQNTVGFIFQFHFLLPDFTALENLLIPARIRRRLGAEDRRWAERLLAALGLTERSDHLPGELSGGEQQRVAVARAFMNRPQIVLADEPFGNLDRQRSERLGQLMFDLCRELGTGMIIVTHDLELAGRAERTLHLADGRLTTVGAEVDA
jgi:lipoprotein-releasing system ATP-binding protein